MPQLRCRFEQMIGRNIDRHVDGEVAKMLEKHARLETRSAAELDQARLRATA
jgi:hypothetical protein